MAHRQVFLKLTWLPLITHGKFSQSDLHVARPTSSTLANSVAPPSTCKYPESVDFSLPTLSPTCCPCPTRSPEGSCVDLRCQSLSLLCSELSLAPPPQNRGQKPHSGPQGPAWSAPITCLSAAPSTSPVLPPLQPRSPLTVS